MKKTPYKKKCKDKDSTAHLELVGGVFVVEKFKDGTERREEIDGVVVLKLLLMTVHDGINDMIKKYDNK